MSLRDPGGLVQPWTTGAVHLIDLGDEGAPSVMRGTTAPLTG
jgi:hypothetical protein